MPMTITRRPGLLSYVNDGTSNVWYDLGLEKPNFPVPAIYCFSLISKEVDQRACDINITDMALSMLKS